MSLENKINLNKQDSKIHLTWTPTSKFGISSFWFCCKYFKKEGEHFLGFFPSVPIIKMGLKYWFITALRGIRLQCFSVILTKAPLYLCCQELEMSLPMAAWAANVCQKHGDSQTATVLQWSMKKQLPNASSGRQKKSNPSELGMAGRKFSDLLPQNLSLDLKLETSKLGLPSRLKFPIIFQSHSFNFLSFGGLCLPFLI